MKRLVVYYSLSGNTEEAAKTIAERLGADLLKLETVKAMPKSFAAQMFIGGGQVVFNHIPRLKPFGIKISDYDEIILGSPIWNNKGVPAINAFLKDEDAAKKVTSLFFSSGGGEIEKGLSAITVRLPNLKNTLSLLNRKHKDSSKNAAKTECFIAQIGGTYPAPD